MSGSFPHFNPALNSMRRLDNKLESTGESINDFIQREKMGEKPDPEEFMRILEQRSTVKSALQAQFKLHETPLKTVLNETK